MTVVDAYTGREVHVGDRVPSPTSAGELLRCWTLLAVRDRFLTATARVRYDDGREVDVPLTVRFLHPDFICQRVGFFPS